MVNNSKDCSGIARTKPIFPTIPRSSIGNKMAGDFLEDDQGYTSSSIKINGNTHVNR